MDLFESNLIDSEHAVLIIGKICGQSSISAKDIALIWECVNVIFSSTSEISNCSFEEAFPWNSLVDLLMTVICRNSGLSFFHSCSSRDDIKNLSMLGSTVEKIENFNNYEEVWKLLVRLDNKVPYVAKDLHLLLISYLEDFHKSLADCTTFYSSAKGPVYSAFVKVCSNFKCSSILEKIILKIVDSSIYYLFSSKDEFCEDYLNLVIAPSVKNVDAEGNDHILEKILQDLNSCITGCTSKSKDNWQLPVSIVCVYFDHGAQSDAISSKMVLIGSKTFWIILKQGLVNDDFWCQEEKSAFAKKCCPVYKSSWTVFLHWRVFQ